MDGFRTVHDPLKEFPGSDVLVVGGLAQSVGLYAVKAAKMLGAKRVIYRDYDERRLSAAKRFGAEAIKTEYSKDLRIDEQFSIVVEAAGLPDALTFALMSTAPCGICTGVSAGVGQSTEIPLRSMYMKGITYNVSRVHARGSIADLVCSDKCNHFRADEVLDATIPFSQAADAMCEGNIKTVFVAD